jgi:hypothetical protein
VEAGEDREAVIVTSAEASATATSALSLPSGNIHWMLSMLDAAAIGSASDAGHNIGTTA